MKRVIKASRREGHLPITKLTEDEISALPEKVTLVTRTPGASTYSPEFKITPKDALYHPDECFFIDSYWGYARGRDVYLASKAEVEKYYNRIIEDIKAEMNKYTGFAL